MNEEEKKEEREGKEAFKEDMVVLLKKYFIEDEHHNDPILHVSLLKLSEELWNFIGQLLIHNAGGKEKDGE